MPVHDKLPAGLLVAGFDSRHHRLDARAPLGRKDERGRVDHDDGGHTVGIGGSQL